MSDLKAPRPASGPTCLVLPLEGLHCASCVSRIEAAVARVPGVTGAVVNLAARQADIRFAETPDVRAVIAAVRSAGFAVPEQTDELEIEGTHCASCVSRLEHAIAAVPGVTSASVNLATARAAIRSPAGLVARASLVEAIGKAGYGVREAASAGVAKPGEDPDRRESRALQRDVTLAAVLAVPLVALAMGGHMVPAIHAAITQGLGTRVDMTVQALLAGLILLGPGRRFFRTGLPLLLRGHPDMNTLVALGAGAAYAYSLGALLAPHAFTATDGAYFEAAGVIVLLVLLGRLLEAGARGRAGDALRRLLSRAPKRVHVLVDGQESTVAAEAIRIGDLIRIRPGETVALDGIVEAGASRIDESMITGESGAVAKRQGDAVVGGTLNTTGSVDVRVTAVGAGTVLARIVDLVRTAQGTKLPVQALTDRVAAWFVPAMIGIAVLTFAGWTAFGPSSTEALIHAVAVLLIACPCALGLAVPISIMVGIGRAARLGILFRRGDALQRLRDVRTIAFDKTGTLTEGRPRLTDIVPLGRGDPDDLLALAAALEQRSEHAIATAVVEAAAARGLPPQEVDGFEALPGRGITGRVAGRQVELGNARAMHELGRAIEGGAGEAARVAEAGKTPVFLVVEGTLEAVLAVADPIRPGARAMVAALRAEGRRTVMLTGDHAGSAAAVARQLGIDEVAADLLPEGKVAAIRRLGAAGGLAFVGDGINDAPALAAAEVGIAIGTGTDVALESAEVVLMAADLEGIVRAVALSRAVMANIRQNLFWAFAYNVTLVPVAAGLPALFGGPTLSPVLGAGAMALSSLFVVLNALRLSWFGRAVAPRNQTAPVRQPSHPARQGAQP